MQAEYNTSINVSGSQEELKQIIDVLKKLEAKEFPAYLVRIKLKKEKQYISLEELKGDSEVDAFIAESGGTIDIDADGPWGRYQRLEDAKIFEKIAEAAPSASFYGKTEGGTSYTTENIEGELKNGILHLESFFEANEESDEEYYSFLSKKMPLERFIEVFKIDEEEFDEDSYEDYLTDSTCYDSFMREDYDEFIECCEAAGINKTEYKTLKKQFSKEGLDWEDFVDNFEGGSTEEYDYDPVKKEYLDAVRNDPLNQPGIVSITPDNLGVSQEEYDNMTMDDVYAAIEKKLGLERKK